MNKIVRNNKGITLVALVVTIIILIILAGVSINLVLGQDGIIERAKMAKEKTEQAAENEQKTISSFINYIDNQGGNIEIKEYAPYDKPYIPNGFRYKEGSWNNGYTIIGETENVNDEFVWVPCVLDQSKVKEGDTVVTFEKVTEGKYNENNLGLLPTDTNVQAEDSSVNEIRASVGKYGGFYIAKYEAGVNGEIDNYSLSTKMLTDGTVKPLSQAEKGVWNYITRADAIIVSKAMINKTNTGVKSTLISGECWDTTLQWMVNASSSKASNVGYDTNSAGKGWYNDVSSNTRHITGYYAVNNIYDMAGNIWEWTTENCIFNNINYFVYRGGESAWSGSVYPVATRGYNNTYINFDMGFRVVIYK